MKNLLIILFFVQLSGFSQDDPNARIDTVYLDKNWFETNTFNEAVYFRIVHKKNLDSVLNVEDYYIDSKTLQMTGAYLGTMRNHNQIGIFNFYYRNGNLKTIYNYDKGRINGKVLRFYENGEVSVIENYENGVKSDTIQFFYENGLRRKTIVKNTLYSKRNPAAGKMEFKMVEAFDSKGTQQVINGTGIFIDYQRNGKRKVMIEYLNGFPHGEWIQYQENKKKISSTMTFKNGLFIKGIIYENGKKEIFASLDRQARYPSGIVALDAFVKKHTGDCEEFEKNEIQVIINIDRQGNAEFEQILEGYVTPCQLDEIKSMVQKMPKWIPAISSGKYIESSYIFRLSY